MTPIEILREIRKETDEIILFHSLSGKDSIYLLDMCSQVFKKVHCVHMYVIEGLEHMEKYLKYFQKAYTNTVWYQTEHFAVTSFKKYGEYGYPETPKLKLESLASIMKKYRKIIGLDWIVLGSKQADGLARRLQLKTYEHQAIDRKNHKVFPLSRLTNKDILNYIKINQCIPPMNFGDKKARSSSTDITSPLYLSWLKRNSPNDLQKIFKVFPETELILFLYESEV